MPIARVGFSAALLAALAASPCTFAELPPIGSPNVAIADPDIPPPPGDACVVRLPPADITAWPAAPAPADATDRDRLPTR